MGREIQKRKNRSSAQKIRQKPKSKKHVLNNPVIAANWDSTQTLSQNYRRLGLAARLNKHTGGVERRAGDVEQLQTQDGLSIARRRRKEELNAGEVRIERDPETGAILRVLDGGPAAEAARKNPLNDPLADLDSEDEEGEPQTQAQKNASWASLTNQHGNVPAGSYVDDEAPRTGVVRELEARANAPKEKYKRKQPEGERVFVDELVRKWGDDYGKMARDMKVNYMQRSEGDIKRRVKKWREEGGSIDGQA